MSVVAAWWACWHERRCAEPQHQPTGCPCRCCLYRRYTLAVGAGGLGAALFIGGFVVASIQEE